MKIYISGKVSGEPLDEVIDRFNEAEYIIWRAGHEAVNPTDISHWGFQWDTYMQIARDIILSGDIDVVYMLEGWQQSNGAQAEWLWANSRELPILYQSKADRDKYGDVRSKRYGRQIDQ